MSEEGSEKEYRDDVCSMADDVWEHCDEECETCEGSDYLHECVDGSQWIIYYWRATRVLQYSRNDDQIFEEMGNDVLSGCTSMGDVYTRAAYFAMKQDVIEELEDRPDPTLTYTLEWDWDLEYWPEDEDKALDEESENESEEFNTLNEAEKAMKAKRAELQDLLSRCEWTSCSWHLSITDSDGEERESEAS